MPIARANAAPMRHVAKLLILAHGVAHLNARRSDTYIRVAKVKPTAIGADAQDALRQRSAYHRSRSGTRSQTAIGVGKSPRRHRIPRILDARVIV